MDIEFTDSPEVPRGPEEVRILDVQAAVLSDQRRIELTIVITPFLEPPNLEIEAIAEDGTRVSSTIIIGVPNKIVSLVLHLRGEIREGRVRVRCTLKYDDLQLYDTAETFVTIMQSFASSS